MGLRAMGTRTRSQPLIRADTRAIAVASRCRSRRGAKRRAGVEYGLRISLGRRRPATAVIGSRKTSNSHARFIKDPAVAMMAHRHGGRCSVGFRTPQGVARPLLHDARRACRGRAMIARRRFYPPVKWSAAIAQSRGRSDRDLRGGEAPRADAVAILREMQRGARPPRPDGVSRPRGHSTNPSSAPYSSRSNPVASERVSARHDAHTARLRQIIGASSRSMPLDNAQGSGAWRLRSLLWSGLASRGAPATCRAGARPRDAHRA